MPATTPTYAIPYPESTDAPNGPAQMQALALEVEAEIARVDGLISAGPLVKACRVYNSASISLTSGAYTALTFNSERFDTDTMHSTVSNQSRITFTTAGLYAFGGNVSFAANATGLRALGIRMGGATYLSSQQVPSLGASAATELETHGIYAFTAGQYIELLAAQFSGGALNALAGPNYSPEFWAARIGRVV